MPFSPTDTAHTIDAWDDDEGSGVQRLLLAAVRTQCNLLDVVAGPAAHKQMFYNIHRTLYTQVAIVATLH